MKNAVGIVLIIIFAGLGFLAGMKYQQNKTASLVRPRFGESSGRQIGPRTGANMIRGEIIDKDDETLTIKQADGSTKIILLSGNTKVNKSAAGSVADLQIGEQVMIFGQENTDKTVSAIDVQLGSGMRFDQTRQAN